MFLNITFTFKISKLKYGTMGKIRKVLAIGFVKQRFIEKLLILYFSSRNVKITQAGSCFLARL